METIIGILSMSFDVVLASLWIITFWVNLILVHWLAYTIVYISRCGVDGVNKVKEALKEPRDIIHLAMVMEFTKKIN